MPTISTADFDDIRKNTLQAHEITALFESVAGISGVAEPEDEMDTHTQEGASVNAYGSPLSLWEVKMGHLVQTPPATRSLWSRVKWGVCQAAIEEMGAEGRRPEGVMLDDANPRMSSRVDMEISLDLGTTWEPMVAKNVTGSMLDTWRNAVGEWVVPEATILEAQHHMMVRGAQRLHIAAMFSGTTVRRFIVERDEELIAEIAHAGAQFWNRVDTNTRPKATTPGDQKVIARLNAIIDPKEEILDFRGDSTIQQMLAERERIKAEQKALQAQSNALDAELRARMDGFAAALVSDTHQLRWVRTAAQEITYTKHASAHLRTTKISKRAAGSTLDALIEPQP